MTYITLYHITASHLIRPEYVLSPSVGAKGPFVAMKISLFILILGSFAGIFSSWVYSQRPYFHWIKSKN